MEGILITEIAQSGNTGPSINTFSQLAATLEGVGRIPCPSASKRTRARPVLARPSITTFSSLAHLSSASDIYRASSDFASSQGCVAVLPHFEETPPTGVHPEAVTYAHQQAKVAACDLDPSTFAFTQIGDLVIWSACTEGDEHLSGLTYVSPSHTLAADLIIGIHMVSTPQGPSNFTDECIARFTLLCHAISVPKTRALLMQTQQTDVKPLSPRQREVLRASVNGATAKQVSEMLNISARTVDLHIQAAMAKLNCTTKAHAVLRASRLGLI